MESESSVEGALDSESVRSKSKSHTQKHVHKEETAEVKAPAGTPHSASQKLSKRALFPTTPASYSDDDSCHGLGRKKRRKYTTDGKEKQPNPGIHLSERQQVLLLKTFASENSPKPSSPALSAASSSQGTYSASSGTDRLHKRNIRGETLLHIASHRGDTKQMVELIDQGLDVNALDNADWTPLHEACNKGHFEAAKILLKHGAQVNARGDEDITPLHDAAGSGSVELVKLLLEHGADPNARDKTGRLPIDVPVSPTIINVIKLWPTYKAHDESSNMSIKIDAFSCAESSSLVPEGDFADSPRVASSANVHSPNPQSISSSTYDSVPPNFPNEDEHCITPRTDEADKAATSPLASSGGSTLKQNESIVASESQQREPPSLQAVSATDDAQSRLSVETTEENPPPPLLTPQLPDDGASAAARSPSGPLVQQCSSPSPLPPPCLESAVSAMAASLETITSSPPLVVITTDTNNRDGEKASASGDRPPTSSSELLLQVCTREKTKEREARKTDAPSTEGEHSTTEDEVKNAGATPRGPEPTVASSRTRRKIASTLIKEAPVSASSEKGKSAYRRRLGSVGVISPANKDSSSSNSAAPAETAALKVQPLRKRLIHRSDEDNAVKAAAAEKPVKEKKKTARERSNDTESNNAAGGGALNDPYEFVEEPEVAMDAPPQQGLGSTPTSSPRSSVGHNSPFKQLAANAASSTAQSSPTMPPSGQSKGNRRHRSRQPSSPSSLTPNEMKLPPLKIRINRPTNPVAEASRQSESESSVSSTCGVKTELSDDHANDDPSGRSDMATVKDEPQGGDGNAHKTASVGSEEAALTNDSNVGNSVSSVPPRKRKVRGSGATSPVAMLSVVTNVSGSTPVVSPSSLPTQEQVAQFFTVEKPRLPNYIRQWQAAKEWVVERRKQQLVPVQLPTVPRGVGDFLMIRKSYLLAASAQEQQPVPGLNPNQETQPPQPPASLIINSNSNTSAGATTPPQQQPSPTLPPSLQALFRSQEEARHRLRLQHRVEQEKLVLCYEQEVLRAYVHRELTAIHAQPLSACAILSERHLASRAPPEALMTPHTAQGQAGAVAATAASDPNVPTTLSAQQRALRLTVRHQRPRLDDLDEKFSRLVEELLQRQRHEAAAMRAVQSAEWAWRSEILGLMSGSDTALPSSESSSAPVNNVVPLVTVPESLPIPRLI